MHRNSVALGHLAWDPARLEERPEWARAGLVSGSPATTITRLQSQKLQCVRDNLPHTVLVTVSYMAPSYLLRLPVAL